MFLLLTYFTLFSSVSIVDFEQVNVSWDRFEIQYRCSSGDKKDLLVPQICISPNIVSCEEKISWKHHVEVLIFSLSWKHASAMASERFDSEILRKRDQLQVIKKKCSENIQ